MKDIQNIKFFASITILFVLLTLFCADVLASEISIESSQLTPLSIQDDAKLISFINENYERYNQCGFSSMPITLEGTTSQDAIFITTESKCWGAWQGPIWIIAKDKNKGHSTILYATTATLEFQNSEHNGLKDILLLSGPSGYNIKQHWQFDGNKYKHNVTNVDQDFYNHGK